MTETNNTFSTEEKRVYDFCIKMGDTHEQAIASVEIHRKRVTNSDLYRAAYES